jgi:hypothetical protein
VNREEVSQKRLNSIRGIENLARLDESLYQDFETEEVRKVCREMHLISLTEVILDMNDMQSHLK